MNMYWLREKVHPTWHVTTVAFGFVAGVVCAQWMSVPPVVTLLIGGGLIGLACWKQRRMLLIVALIGGLLLGVARGSADIQARLVYAVLVGKQAMITATVSDDIDMAKRDKLHLKLANVTLDGKRLPGKIFATVSGSSTMRRSDIVTVNGIFDKGFGSFAATLQGTVTRTVRPTPGDVALDIRDGFAAHVKRAIRDPAASLGIGYLLGKKSALPDDLVTALQATGLTHIVVASGYNLTILVRAGRRLFARTSKYLAAMTGVLLVVGFVLMTGFSATMMRAGLVALLSLWAWYYGRTFHPITLLGVAAAVTLVIDPSFAWGDLGWLLSFAAFAGVMIVAPIATSYFFGKEKVPFVGQLLIETIAAQIVTLPIMIVAFHQMSIIAPLANILILPLIPLTMALVAVTGLGVWLAPDVATIIGWPVQHVLDLQLSIIDWCANLPGALIKPTWNNVVVIGYLLGIAVVVVYMKWRTKFSLRTASIVE